jgi:hypothetical protein
MKGEEDEHACRLYLRCAEGRFACSGCVLCYGEERGAGAFQVDVAGSQAKMGVDQNKPESGKDSGIKSCSKGRNVDLLLMRMKLKKEEATGEYDLKHSTSTREEWGIYDYSRAYIRFAGSITLSPSLRPITAFDIKIFCGILLSDRTDEVIHRFVERLVEDPMCYSKDEKHKAYLILILGYIHALKHKLPLLEKVRKKVAENEHLFKPVTHMDIGVTEDAYIDRFVLSLRREGCGYEDAVFLNHFYRRYLGKPRLDRDIFLGFQQRLNASLKMIQGAHLSSFLRIVFLKETVLFSCATNAQVAKLILDFYGSKARAGISEAAMSSILTTLALILDKMASLELYGSFAMGALDFATSYSRSDKHRLLLQLRNFTALSDFVAFFQERSNSFNGMKMGLGFLVQMIDGAAEDADVLMGLLEIILSIFDIFKIEFVIKILREYLDSMRALVVRLTRSIEDVAVEKILSFNSRHWNKFSKIILASQRYLSVIDDEKKKCSSAGHPMQRTVKAFVSSIYSLEARLLALFPEEDRRKAVLIKTKSFRIEERREETPQ